MPLSKYFSTIKKTLVLLFVTLLLGSFVSAAQIHESVDNSNFSFSSWFFENVTNTLSVSEVSKDDIALGNLSPRYVREVGSGLHLVSYKGVPLENRIAEVYENKSFSVFSIVSKVSKSTGDVKEILLSPYAPLKHVVLLSAPMAEAQTATVRAKPNVPLIDRISLSLFCSLSSRSIALASERCNYEKIASGELPPLVSLTAPESVQKPTLVETAPLLTSGITQVDGSNKKTPTEENSPSVAKAPVQIINYINQYLPGPSGPSGTPGTPGRDGRDAKDSQGGFGGFVYPTYTASTQSLVGVSTIGYLNNATIDSSLFNGGTATNMLFRNGTINNSLFTGSNIFNDNAYFTGNVVINNLTATSSLITYATTTNSYIENLVVGNATTTNGFVSYATTTQGYIARLFADEATTTNAYIANLTVGTTSADNVTLTGTLSVAGTSTLATTTITSATITNATSTTLFATLLNAVTTIFTNLTATNATTTNLVGTNSLFTNGTTTNLFTQNLSVGNASTTGNQNVDGQFTVSGTSTLGANVFLNGNVTVGTSSNETLTVNALVNSNFAPSQNKIYDLGSNSFYWRTLYADNINVNTISAASTTISGTSNNDFTINSDNGTTDTEDIALVFFRGLVTPNALVRWNATTKRLETNQSLKILNETPSIGSTTLTVQAGVGQGTYNLLEILNNAGTKLSAFTSQGWLGIGSTTPSSALTVIGNTYLGGNVTATGTLNISGTSTLATTTATTLTVSGQTTLSNASSTNFTSSGATVLTNATSTNFFSTLLNAVTAIFTNLTATNATTTNLVSTNSTTTLLAAVTASTTNLTALTATVTNGTITNASTTNLTVANNAYFGGNTGIWNGSGNVGVGTIAPNDIFEISKTSSGAATTNLRLTNAATAASTEADIIFNLSTVSADMAKIGAIRTNSPNNGDTDLVFSNRSNSLMVETLRIKSSGNVGIGTTTPGTRLTVSGTTTLVGAVTSPTALRVIGNIDNTADLTFNPRIISSSATGVHPIGVYVSGNYAYVVNQNENSVSIVDISNPSAPVTISTVLTGAGPGGIYVSGNYAYVANSDATTISIIDISNPFSPVVVSTPVTGPNPGSVFVSGRYAYVTNMNGPSLAILDISNPRIPVLVSSVAIGGQPFSVYVLGKYAYVANYSGNSLAIIDISNPVAPVTVSTPATGIHPTSVSVSGRYAYVTNNGSSTVSIIDISNPVSPVTVSAPATGLNPYNSFVSGRYLYVTNYGSDTVSVFDIKTPASPVNVSTVAVGDGPGFLYVSGRHLYLTIGSDSLLQILDIGGIESTSATIHSLDVGNLAIRNDLTLKGILDVGTSLVIGRGGFQSQGNSSISGSLTIGTSSYPLFFADAANNRLNIGTSTGAATLFVQGTSTANPFTVASSTGTSLFSILANGNVGIGTTGPVSKLEVVDTNAIVTSRGSAGYGAFYAIGSTGNSSYLFMGTNSVERGRLETSSGGDVIFHNSSSGSVTEKMRITAAGNVGIGTTTPETALTVRGGNTVLATDPHVLTARFGANSVASSAGVGVGSYTGGYGALQGLTFSTNTGSYLYLNPAGGNVGIGSASGLGSSASTLSISGGTAIGSGYWDDIAPSNGLIVQGNVGIGDPSPSVPLEVAGVGIATDQIQGRGSSNLNMYVNESGTTASYLALNYFNQSSWLPSVKVANVASGFGTLQLMPGGGNVGIGTTTPTTRLTVSGTTTLVGSASSPTALRVVGNIDNTASSDIAPRLAGTLVTGQPYGIAVSGKYAYVINASGDLFNVVDVSNPASPAVVGTTTPGDNPGYVSVAGKYAYVSNYNDGSVSVIDISNPAAPSVVGVVTGVTNARYSLVRGNYLYVEGDSTGISTIDISSPRSPKLVGFLSVGSAYNLVGEGRYLYVVRGTTFSIIDTNNPLNLSIVNTQSVGSNLQAIAVSGKYVYVSDFSGGTLNVYNVANPASISLVSSISIPASSSVMKITGRYLYVTYFSNANVQVIDVGDPTAPVVVNNVSTSGNGPNSIDVSGRYMYVGSISSGRFDVYDIGGFESNTGTIHSLEVGNLSVRNNVDFQGVLNLGTGLTIGRGGFQSQGNSSISGSLTIGTSSYPLFFADAANNRLNIGTSTGAATLFVQGTSTANPFTVASSTGTSLFSILANGNVGIGTTTPGSKLDVWGNLNVGTSTTPTLFANTALTRVGIGTNSPSSALHVVGTSRIEDGNYGFLGFWSGGGFFGGVGTVAGATGSGSVTDLALVSDASRGMHFYTNGAANERMTITSTGNVGIGTTTPGSKLDVWGNLNVGTSSTPTLFANTATGNVGIGVSNPAATFQVGGTVSPARYLQVDNVGRMTLRYDDNSLQNIITLRNSSITSSGQGTAILAQISDGAAAGISAGRIGFMTENAVTSFAGATADAAMTFATTLDGSLSERMRLTSAGSLHIGAGGTSSASLRISKAITGGTSAYSTFQDGTIQSDATIDVSYNRTVASTAAASFTLPTLYHYNATQGSFGSGSAVTTQIGYFAESTLTGATNNYGFYGAIASSTGRYNLYMPGTAANYLAGNLGIGTTNPSYQTQIYGSGQQTAALTDAGATGGSLFLNTPTVNAGDGGALLIGAGGTGNKPFAAIKGLLTDGNANTVGDLAFSTRNSTAATALTERMRILADGKVGIGTSNPSAKLQVLGSDTLPVYVSTSDTAAYMRFLTGNTVSRGAFGYTSTGASFLNAALNVANMTILDGGNVGIGTTNPSAKLEVTGGTAMTSGWNRTMMLTDSYPGVIFNSTAGSKFAGINYDSTSFLNIRVGASSNDIYASGVNAISINGTNGNTSVGGSALYAQMNGNVGIGTISPLDKLQISADNSIVGLGESGGANLIYNGGAEDQNNGWTVRDFAVDGSVGGGGYVSSASLSGSNSFLASNDGGVNQAVELIPSAIYTVSLRMRVNVQGGGDGSQGRIVVGTTATARDITDQVCNPDTYDTTPNTNKWVLCSATFTAPSATDTKTVTTYVGFRAESSTHSVLVDNVMLSRGGIAQSYNPTATFLGSNGATAFSGNIGIGTLTPDALITAGSASGSHGYLRLKGPTIAEGNIYHDAIYGVHLDTNSNAYPIKIDGSALVLGMTGNVGIGTTTPASKLQISGDNNYTGFGGGLLRITGSTDPLSRIEMGYNTTSNEGFIQAGTGGGSVRSISLNPNGGNVGIGTTTPGSNLDIYNNSAAGDVNIFRILTNVGSTRNVKFRIDSDGDVFTDGGTTIGTPADLAENYPALEAVDAGTVVAFGSSTVAWEQASDSATSTETYQISGVRKATNGYEAVGVISTKAGITLGGSTTNGVPVAFSGRIPVKVTAENGAVVRGDYLTVSASMPGYAMKLTGEGKSIGRAISDYTPGNDKVMMLVENGYQKLDTTGRYATTTAMLTTGNIDLNANGVAITNIKSLASANGTWSIDESGRIIARTLCLEDVCIDKTMLQQILSSTGIGALPNGGTPSGGGSVPNGGDSGTTTDEGGSGTTTIDFGGGEGDTGTTTPTGGDSGIVIEDNSGNGTSTEPLSDAGGDSGTIASTGE